MFRDDEFEEWPRDGESIAERLIHVWLDPSGRKVDEQIEFIRDDPT
jgi:hypothetical protein